MDSILKIAVFIASGLALSQLVNLVFRFVSKGKKLVHLIFFRSILDVLIYVVTIYILAQQFEVTKELSTHLLQSGSLIIAIATFAAQQALSNVISGFSLSFSKPYDVEDKIKVVSGGSVIAEGHVKNITLRHTVISQFNGESCIVPNSVMDAAVITNTNFTDNIGNFMEVVISYDADLHKAMKIMQTICIEHELTLNTVENKVFVKGYAADGVILKTTVWTKNLDDSFQACSDIRIRIVEQFREHGIEIPYQTVTVRCEAQPEGVPVSDAE
ncbi:mechanosensitive ion channel family protein [Lachnospiraceae bacterium JLR.KK008]